MEQYLLFDFYGELLTPHQQQIYEEFVIQDLSLSEIAEEHNISRQGVHDLVKRTNKTLTGYEEKLHLVKRFVSMKEKIEQIHEMTKDPGQEQIEILIDKIDKIRKISNEMLEEL